MGTAARKTIRIWILALALAAGSLLSGPELQSAAAEPEEPDGTRPNLTITVLEDIPAEEIDENEVPLAGPEGPAEPGSRDQTQTVIFAASTIVLIWLLVRNAAALNRSGRKTESGRQAAQAAEPRETAADRRDENG